MQGDTCQFANSPEPEIGSRRFSGLDRLFGVVPAGQVRAAHVAVVGIGGVGSWAVEALVRSGVSRITMIDMDHVAESNINRQVHALDDTIGMAKIDDMRLRMQLINPNCQVTAIDNFVDAENWPHILPSDVDGVIDACDQVRAKTAMATWARNQVHIPFISVGAAGGKRFGHEVAIADLAAVTHDPLLAQVRYQLRKHHAAPKHGKCMHLQCVYSKEPVVSNATPLETKTDNTLNCHGYGSIVSVTATFGMCAAGWMMDKLSKSQNTLKNAL